MRPRLVLASRSPQRRAILTQVGIPFEVRPTDVAERDAGEPSEVAADNARAKARAVEADLPVLGVDTVVVLDGTVHGKPPDAAAAAAMLAALDGREHEVLSGLCLRDPGGGERTTVVRTRVRMRALGPSLREWYVRSEEWRERAGGYAIQGRGAALVSAIQGDYLNVVGLPLSALLELEPSLLTG